MAVCTIRKGVVVATIICVNAEQKQLLRHGNTAGRTKGHKIPKQKKPHFNQKSSTPQQHEESEDDPTTNAFWRAFLDSTDSRGGSANDKTSMLEQRELFLNADASLGDEDDWHAGSEDDISGMEESFDSKVLKEIHGREQTWLKKELEQKQNKASSLVDKSGQKKPLLKRSKKTMVEVDPHGKTAPAAELLEKSGTAQSELDQANAAARKRTASFLQKDGFGKTCFDKSPRCGKGRSGIDLPPMDAGDISDFTAEQGVTRVWGAESEGNTGGFCQGTVLLELYEVAGLALRKPGEAALVNPSSDPTDPDAGGDLLLEKKAVRSFLERRQHSPETDWIAKFNATTKKYMANTTAAKTQYLTDRTGFEKAKDCSAKLKCEKYVPKGLDPYPGGTASDKYLYSQHADVNKYDLATLHQDLAPSDGGDVQEKIWNYWTSMKPPALQEVTTGAIGKEYDTFENFIRYVRKEGAEQDKQNHAKHCDNKGGTFWPDSAHKNYNFQPPPPVYLGAGEGSDIGRHWCQVLDYCGRPDYVAVEKAQEEWDNLHTTIERNNASTDANDIVNSRGIANATAHGETWTNVSNAKNNFAVSTESLKGKRPERSWDQAGSFNCDTPDREASSKKAWNKELTIIRGYQPPWTLNLDGSRKELQDLTNVGSKPNWAELGKMTCGEWLQAHVQMEECLACTATLPDYKYHNESVRELVCMGEDVSGLEMARKPEAVIGIGVQCYNARWNGNPSGKEVNSNSKNVGETFLMNQALTHWTVDKEDGTFTDPRIAWSNVEDATGFITSVPLQPTQGFVLLPMQFNHCNKKFSDDIECTVYRANENGELVFTEPNEVGTTRLNLQTDEDMCGYYPLDLRKSELESYDYSELMGADFYNEKPWQDVPGEHWHMISKQEHNATKDKGRVKVAGLRDVAYDSGANGAWTDDNGGNQLDGASLLHKRAVNTSNYNDVMDAFGKISNSSNLTNNSFTERTNPCHTDNKASKPVLKFRKSQVKTIDFSETLDSGVNVMIGRFQGATLIPSDWGNPMLDDRYLMSNGQKPPITGSSVKGFEPPQMGNMGFRGALVQEKATTSKELTPSSLRKREPLQPSVQSQLQKKAKDDGETPRVTFCHLPEGKYETSQAKRMTCDLAHPKESAVLEVTGFGKFCRNTNPFDSLVHDQEQQKAQADAYAAAGGQAGQAWDQGYDASGWGASFVGKKQVDPYGQAFSDATTVTTKTCSSESANPNGKQGSGVSTAYSTLQVVNFPTELGKTGNANTLRIYDSVAGHTTTGMVNIGCQDCSDCSHFGNAESKGGAAAMAYENVGGLVQKRQLQPDMADVGQAHKEKDAQADQGWSKSCLCQADTLERIELNGGHKLPTVSCGKHFKWANRTRSAADYLIYRMKHRWHGQKASSVSAGGLQGTLNETNAISAGGNAAMSGSVNTL